MFFSYKIKDPSTKKYSMRKEYCCTQCEKGLMLCTYVYTDLGGGQGRNGYHVIRDLAKEYIYPIE